MQEEHEVLLVVIIVILIGIYCIMAAIFNWNWFFNNSRARGISKMLKRTGA
ncbi:MAG: immunity 17 family protein, partial [Oscillospiraceae bacterium]|nr:immunity 17 family protein [Oscillospiraceae bacterium]